MRVNKPLLCLPQPPVEPAELELIEGGFARRGVAFLPGDAMLLQPAVAEVAKACSDDSEEEESDEEGSEGKKKKKKPILHGKSRFHKVGVVVLPVHLVCHSYVSRAGARPGHAQPWHCCMCPVVAPDPVQGHV